MMCMTYIENNKIDAYAREIAVNAQHMINMIRLRNHAGHSSKAKQKSDAQIRRGYPRVTYIITYFLIFSHITNDIKITPQH